MKQIVKKAKEAVLPCTCPGLQAVHAFIIALVWVMFIAGYSSLAAEMRLDKRVSHALNWTYQNDDCFSFQDWAEEEVQYLPGYPEVLQNLLIKRRLLDWDGTDSGWVDQPAVQFNPQVIDNPEGRIIIYNIMPLNNQRIEEYDTQNRMRMVSLIRVTDTGYYSSRTHYYYGNFSSPDSSITATNYYPAENTYRKCISNYDSEGFKQKEYTWESQDSLTWQCTSKATFYHSGQLLPPNFQYRLHHPLFAYGWSGMAMPALNWYHPGLYGRAMPDSIIIQRYNTNSGQWEPYQKEEYQFNVCATVVGVTITVWDLDMIGYPDYAPGIWSMSFTPEGYFAGQSWIGDDYFSPPSWGVIDYYWEQAVSVNDAVSEQPPRITMGAYPNPFNPETTLRFTLPVAGEVRLMLYNIRGQQVQELLCEKLPIGEHTYVWKADKSLASGLYFVEIRSGAMRERMKLMLVK